MSEKEWDWAEDSDLDLVRKGLQNYILAVLEEPDPSPSREESIHELRGRLRKAARVDFIDSRQLVLSGLLEGISLDANLKSMYCTNSRRS